MLHRKLSHISLKTFFKKSISSPPPPIFHWAQAAPTGYRDRSPCWQLLVTMLWQSSLLCVCLSEMLALLSLHHCFICEVELCSSRVHIINGVCYDQLLCITLLIFRHASLGVCSTIRRHQPPQRAVLGQVNCFVQCGVVGSQISLDDVQPHDVITPLWSLPVLRWGSH